MKVTWLLILSWVSRHNQGHAGEGWWLHQCQLHQDACERRELPVHRVPGAAAHHAGGLLANGLGAEVQRDLHDDTGSGGGEGEMSEVLARHTPLARDGGRPAADHTGQRSAPGQLRHPPHRGQRHPGERHFVYILLYLSIHLYAYMFKWINLHVYLSLAD